jgi:trehalose 6-phosphate synthase
VAIFWHSPWPNPESFGICPWQRELVQGLLGADLIGFHVQAHCNNFLDTVDRALEARVDWEHFSVKRNDHWSIIRPIPISVDLPPEEYAAEDKRSEEYLSEIRQHWNFEASVVAIGVDRMDYTKGILERFQAVESMLMTHPQHQGEFTLIQIGAPTRSTIPRYAELQREIEAEAERINALFRRGKWQPILLIQQQQDHKELTRYFRAARICMVTSLHDGMNLVAKEFVASHRDERGVLILSRFTGAARELRDALIVNPYDITSTGEAIAQALAMDSAEATDRMRRMRKWISDHNIYWWANKLLSELCDLRLETASDGSAFMTTDGDETSESTVIHA